GVSLAQQNRDYFVEAGVDNLTPFVGQQIIYTFRFFAASDINLPPQTRYQPSTFEGFWYGGESGEEQTIQQIGNRQYIVREIRTVLYPLRAGTITVAPAGIVFPATVFRDEQTLTADPITFTVQPLPDSAPVGYNGAVGHFDMTVSVDRVEVKQGEPVLLRLAVSGVGNLEQMLSPELALPADWGKYPNEPVYRLLDTSGTLAEKVFEWQIVPVQSGEQTLPAVTLYFFDPTNITYRSISTTPVTLRIIPAETSDSARVESPDMAASLNGLRPLKPAPDSLGVVPPDAGLPYGICLAFFLPLGFVLGVGGWDYRRRWLDRNRTRWQQSGARTKAQQTLQPLVKTPPPQVYSGIQMAVLVYLSDKTAIDLTQKGYTELQSIITTNGVSERICKELIVCLEAADEGRFAPGTAGNVSTLVKRTWSALTAADREWQGKA
ncbi:MAG: BatD family protein, partial [Anaerolineae bacterium]|nr:BatD family protein [Anaerolineae bacterium]